MPQIVHQYPDTRLPHVSDDGDYLYMVGGGNLPCAYFAKGKILWRNLIDVLTGEGGIREHTFTLPNNVTPTIVNEKVRYESTYLRFEYEMTNKNKLKCSITVKSKPPISSISIQNVANYPVSVEEGDVVVKMNGKEWLRFPKPTTDKGNILQYDYNTGMDALTITIPEPYYSDLGTYPLVIDPTIIDASAYVYALFGTGKVARDSAGNIYVVFSDNGAGITHKIISSRDGWTTAYVLVGAGGIITTDVPTTWNGIFIDSFDKLHFVWQHVGGASRYSKCTDLANYGLAASWKQANEGSTGYDTLGATYASPDVVSDSTQKIYVSVVAGGAAVTVYEHPGPGVGVWNAGTVAITSAGGKYFCSICLDGNERIHVVCNWYSGTAWPATVWNRSTNIRDSTSWISAAGVVVLTPPTDTSYGDSGVPNVVAKGNKIFVAHHAAQSGVLSHIRCNYSADNGATWAHGSGAGNPGLTVVSYASDTPRLRDIHCMMEGAGTRFYVLYKDFADFDWKYRPYNTTTTSLEVAVVLIASTDMVDTSINAERYPPDASNIGYYVILDTVGVDALKICTAGEAVPITGSGGGAIPYNSTICFQ